MKLLTKTKNALFMIFSYLPRALPAGGTEFNDMAERVRGLSGNICTVDDARFVIATTIMRFDPNVCRASDQKFVTILLNAAAKQVSSSIFQDIKFKQHEAALAAQQAEATATPTAALDGEKTNV